MIMTSQREALPSQNEPLNHVTIDGKNHNIQQPSNGINSPVPLVHSKLPGGANAIAQSPGISSHPPIASPTHQGSQSILPQAPSNEIPAGKPFYHQFLLKKLKNLDDSEYLNELVGKFAPAPGQLSSHQDSEKAKQNILNFLLDTKPLSASPSSPLAENATASLGDGNVNSAPLNNCFPSPSSEKNLPVGGSPALGASAINEESAMGADDAGVFKKPQPPPRQKATPT
jgi:hypothetical protein